MTKWLIGLVPGGIAAVVAALISLPLNSPDDVVFNSATVAIGALLVGLAAGPLWQALQALPDGRLIYLGAMVAGFVAVMAVALIGESTLSGTVKFVTPLAALTFSIVGVLTPLVAQVRIGPVWSLGGPAASLVAALAVGFALAGQGDEPSGKLSLPDVETQPTANPTTGSTAITPAEVEGVTYTVVAGESKLTYTVREKLQFLPNESDAVGSTTSLSGDVHLDGAQSTVSADMSTLSSDQDFRDDYVQQNIFNTDPTVTFIVDDLGDLPETYTAGETYTGTLTGTVTIRGVSRSTTFDIQAQMDGATLQVLGTTDFTWADFQITPPNTSVVTVQDNVHIEVLVIARPA